MMSYIKMEDKKPHQITIANIMTANEAVLHATANLLMSGTRLTPTGKISHAKTRVYTQRYRKEWEEMPDFKGWLTSVPSLPTRAYCTYCKKNLHAHRLSLLKHTCTMKHQRAALMHEAEKAKRQKVKKSTDLEGEDDSRNEVEDDEDGYVVERLEMDENDLDNTQSKQSEEDDSMEDDENNDEVDEESSHVPYDEEDVKDVIKKFKVERSDENDGDTLAKAMAHVNSEYLEEMDDQTNSHMEEVIESGNRDDQIVSIISENNDKEESKESNGTSQSKPLRRIERKIERKPGPKSLQNIAQRADSGIIMTLPNSLPILRPAYQINSSIIPNSGTIGVLQPINALPITANQNKTITLTSGGKTLTLTGGPFTPGTQYVLSKVKGQVPTLVVAGKQNINSNNPTEESSKSDKKQGTPVVGQQSCKKKPRVSTHVIDTSKGTPVGGLQVSLYKLMDGRWTFLNESNTNPNGRCIDLVENSQVNFTAGRYKIHFDVDKYFTSRKIETMYPFIEIVFDVRNPVGHYHIPILLSPFGYSTYRGSEK